MELPEAKNNIVLEGVTVEGYEEERNDECNVDIGIPFSKVTFRCCQNFDALINKVDESEKD